MTPSRLQSRMIVLAVPLIFCLSGSLSNAAAQDNPLAGRDITTTLVRDSGQSVVLGVQKIVIKPGANVKKLLRANGVYPDADAFGLLYDLNPKLDNLGALAPGTELLLLKVQSSGPGPALPAGYLIGLTVDKGLKDELLKTVDALSSATTKATGLDVTRFNNEEDKRAVLASVADLSESLAAIGDVIAGKVRPVNQEMLNQLKAELQILQPTLNGVVQSDRKLNDSDREIIKLVADDLQIKRKTFGEIRDPEQPPTRSSAVQVVVKTLNAGDGSAVANLTIYYVPEALFGRGSFQKTFNRLSPAEQTLPEANYRIWGAQAGDPRPVTEVKRIEVRRRSANEPMTVDLPIIN